MKRTFCPQKNRDNTKGNPNKRNPQKSLKEKKRIEQEYAQQRALFRPAC